MKQTIIDIIIAFLVLTLLLVGAWLIGRNKTPKETFSPPSWGVGRETEEDIPAESETPEIETENAPETTPASYQQVTSKLPNPLLRTYMSLTPMNSLKLFQKQTL